jgi:hypothetical protein
MDVDQPEDAAVVRQACSWNLVQVLRAETPGAYEVFQATGSLGDPEWSVPPSNELLRIAFKDHFINTPDHPVLKRLRGEA